MKERDLTVPLLHPFYNWSQIFYNQEQMILCLVYEIYCHVTQCAMTVVRPCVHNNQGKGMVTNPLDSGSFTEEGTK